MSNVQELPQMVSELVDLSKAYLQEEAVQPFKRVGRTVGVGLAAALLLAIGTVLISIAAMRVIVDLFPDTSLWSALGYTAAFVALSLVALLLLRRMQS